MGVVAFPLWVLDQLIVTPEGEEAPSLDDPLLPTMGLTKANDRAGFKRAVEALVLEPGPTYTFCLWGVSRFADAINWRLAGVPMLPETRLTDVGIHPPIFLVFYKLNRCNDNERTSSTEKDT